MYTALLYTALLHHRIVKSQVGYQSETASWPGTIGAVRGNRPKYASVPMNASIPRKTTSFMTFVVLVLRQPHPHESEHRLRDTDRPHRTVEVSSLMAFPFCRWQHARQLAKQSQQPHYSNQGKVRVLVDLLQHPLPVAIATTSPVMFRTA